jgi:hypothetical protein
MSFTLSREREQSFYALRRYGRLMASTRTTIGRHILRTKVHTLNIEDLDSAHGLVGAEPIGRIETVLTFLIDEGKIEPQFPDDYSTHAGSNKKHWEAHYELIMTVEGRSIRFEAKWPARKHLQPGESQRNLGATLVGIAASFQPGTA